MRLARLLPLASFVALGCGSARPLAPTPDATFEHATSDGGRVLDAPTEAAAGAPGAASDAACTGPVSVRVRWTIAGADGTTPLTCAQAGADAVHLIVDKHLFNFPCADEMGTAGALAPGSHTLDFELWGSGPAGGQPSGAPNPTTCTNDIDCVATPGCGGEICDWNMSMKCRPAGSGGPKGQEGWCTVDSDCKCHGQGAKCDGVYCTFTSPGPTPRVLSTGHLPNLNADCGVVDLGQILFVVSS